MLSTNTDLTYHSKWYKILLWLILIAGVAFRLYHFFYNRSLWEDEIYLSAGIINRSFWQIIHEPLPYLQKAPLGYLLVSKLMVALAGNNEMALRLFPLLCGITSLFVFTPIAKRFLKPLGTLVAIGTLALAPPLIYYQVEAKPYGTELLATLLIIGWYLKYRELATWRQALTWGLYGSVIVWFVYPGIFVLAATGITLFIQLVRFKNYTAIKRLVLVGALWVVSFLINYMLFTRQGSDSGWLVDFWIKHEAYMPHAPLPAVKWIIHHISTFFHHPLGFSWFTNWEQPNLLYSLLNRLFFIPLVFALVGLVWFYRNNRQLFIMVITMFGLAFIMAGLNQYPFHERLLVYLSPFIILLIAAGTEFSFNPYKLIEVGKYVAAAFIIAALFKGSITQVAQPYLFGDYKKSYQREVFQYINKHYQSGDGVYIYYNEHPNYLFYRQLYPNRFNALLGNDYRYSSSNFNQYFGKVGRNMQSVQHSKRIWVIYNTIDAPLGEYIGTPAWYYQNNGGVSRFTNYLKQNYKVLNTFTPDDGGTVTDVHAVLLQVK